MSCFRWNRVPRSLESYCVDVSVRVICGNVIVEAPVPVRVIFGNVIAEVKARLRGA